MNRQVVRIAREKSADSVLPKNRNEFLDQLPSQKTEEAGGKLAALLNASGSLDLGDFPLGS